MGLRIISTGSVLNLRNKIMCHNIQTKDNNQLDIPLKAQERVHRRDNNNSRRRAIRTEKERVERESLMPRIRTIRVKEVSVKQNPAPEQRRIGMKITLSTRVKIMDMAKDMMTNRTTPRGTGTGDRYGRTAGRRTIRIRRGMERSIWI